MRKKSTYEKIFKRPLDFIIALITLIVLLPLIIVISFLVRLKLGSPIMFKQERPGLNEKIFTLYKFRTMTNKKNEIGKLLSDSDRLTKFGKFLRSSSLDELPSLLNVIKGDMSIVGPRPLLIDYLDYYSVKQKQRHLVRPGLTGLAQIRGRNLLSWDEKFNYDIFYLDKLSFKMDLKIIIITFFKVITREGISPRETETSEPFRKEDKISTMS